MGAKLTVALQDDGPFRLDVQLSCATGEILVDVEDDLDAKTQISEGSGGSKMTTTSATSKTTETALKRSSSKFSHLSERPSTKH